MKSLKKPISTPEQWFIVLLWILVLGGAITLQVLALFYLDAVHRWLASW